MDLAEVRTALQGIKQADEFDNWFLKNEKQLANYFYKLTAVDLDKLRFEHFYYDDIITSNRYEEFIRTSVSTEAFDGFLNLISNAAEKLAEIGFFSTSQHLVSNLSDSASKFRLMAINEFAAVEDVRTSYIQVFPVVLESLDKSRTLFEEGNTRQIVDVLVFYYKKAKIALERINLPNIVDELKTLFRDPDYNKRYPFLNHQILHDLLNDVDSFALYPEKIDRERLEPSTIIKELFKKFNSDYFDHPKINHSADNLWGYSKQKILDDVLVRGRGDFSIDYVPITADDKVMLYCFFNLKKHFFTSYAVFQTVTKSLDIFFSNKDYKPVFIDLGCGPMTSGLALADLIHTSTGEGINFSYVGIDIADPMLKKAKSFKNLAIFSSKSEFHFLKNWNDIDYSLLYELAGKNNPIIFNASYLFASSSVDEKDLAAYVSSVANSFSNVYFIFQNPNRIDRNLKYVEFVNNIKSTSLLEQKENIRYKAASSESNEDVSYQILKL